MQQQCFQIQNFVKAGRLENLEIQFEKGIQRFEGRKHELMETIVKLDIEDTDKPVYLYLRENERLRAIIFAGGDEMNAFFVLKDDEENICFARLMGFHMLSIPETSVPGKEIGLMTSYSYGAAKVYSSVIMGQTLNPVKNLLFSEPSPIKERWLKRQPTAASTLCSTSPAATLPPSRTIGEENASPS